jgi:hypothetical protein
MFVNPHHSTPAILLNRSHLTDVRVGMHLLFCSGKELISYNRVEDLLKEQSIKREVSPSLALSKG